MQPINFGFRSTALSVCFYSAKLGAFFVFLEPFKAIFRWAPSTSICRFFCPSSVCPRKLLVKTYIIHIIMMMVMRRKGRKRRGRGRKNAGEEEGEMEEDG